jgi:hypothetical protein
MLRTQWCIVVLLALWTCSGQTVSQCSGDQQCERLSQLQEAIERLTQLVERDRLERATAPAGLPAASMWESNQWTWQANRGGSHAKQVGDVLPTCALAWGLRMMHRSMLQHSVQT